MQISISNAIGGGGGAQGGGGTPSFSNVNSFEFDGIDDKMVSTANYTELNGSTNFSISFWIKPKPLSNAKRGVWELATQGNSETLSCLYSPSQEYILIAFRSQSYYYATTNNSVLPNQWSHIVYTYDGTQSRYNRPEIYVNGALSQGINSGVPYNTSNFNGILNFGRNTHNGYGNNNIDEFAVWNNTTLTQTQANELYNGGTPSDLNNIASGLAQPTTWFRMGENATWNGTSWTMTDVNGGYTNRSIFMVEANRTTDVPTAPSFSNVNSFSFDGVDEHFIGTSTYSELDGQNKMTLSLWMKPISGAPLYEYVVTVPRNSTANEHVFSFQHFENNYLTFTIDGRTTKSVLGNISAINYGQWNHVLCCLDGTLSGADRMRIYINGVDETYQTSIGTFTSLQNASGGLMIGEEPQGAYNPYKGFLDEVAIWSGTDQRANVSAIYNNGEPTDLNNNGLTAPTTWQRMGDLATWNGATWTMTDVNGGYTNRSIFMVEANKTTDVPT